MKVLIVDDTPEIVSLFESASLTQAGIEVTTALSGEEALSLVMSEKYDFISLDILMPGATGLDCIPLLRSACPDAVISVISAHIPENLSPELAACIDVLIAKPVGLNIFQQALSCAGRMIVARKELRSLGIRHKA